ncbi:hypothetical protein AYO49_06335 [Verrucomicrobiaceae bacterium SCGC AG-212-N21]|nr:hypothetical protein AYO49_06335 [Verrucomicrobiaceae bacterium SCGC AG-212-N21]
MFFRENGASVDLVDLYRGRSVFVVLNGPSFQEVDHSLLRQPGIVTFGVNNGAHSFRPNLWACVDDPTRFMNSIWADPCITKFVPMAHFRKPIWDAGAGACSKESVADFPNVVGFRRNEAFEATQWLNEPTINWGNHADRGGGRSVLLAVLRISYLLGFRKVYLLGCDFHMDEASKYWFAEGRTPTAIKNNQNSYRILTRYFEQLAPHFASAGFEVYNCTKDSKLTVFPSMPLEDAIASARVDVSASTEGMYVDRYKLQADLAGAPEKKKPATP